MKKILLLLLLVLNLATGCKQIVIWKYGIRTPKLETPESILDFARKNGQVPENIYLFKDSTAYSGFMKDSLYKKGYFSAIVFDNKGCLIDFNDTTACQWSAVNKIENLKKDAVYLSHYSHQLGTLFRTLVPLDTDTSSGDQSDYDYTVIFTWAKYIGRLNDRLFCINEAARKNQQANIRVISLNVDMQKNWDLKKDQRIKLN